MTNTGFFDVYRLPISTHTIILESFQLTKGDQNFATVPTFWLKLMLFQLTTSRGGRQVTTNPAENEQAFQLTTSRGGRLEMLT